MPLGRRRDIHLGKTCSGDRLPLPSQKTHTRALALASMAPKHREAEPTQRTQPKKGGPAEIPVPKRGDVMRDLGKVARTDKRPPKR